MLTLSLRTKNDLKQLGVPHGVIERAVIEEGTAKSRLITWLFHSNATVIGRVIYFRNGTYAPDRDRGLALLAHEMMHVKQWQEGGLFFLIRYIVEYMRGLFISLLYRLQGKTLAWNWAHNQVSYEKAAMALENEALEKIRQTIVELD